MGSDKSLDRRGELTGRDFERFLAAKGVGDNCPACGSKHTLSIAVNDPGESELGDAPVIRMIRRLHDQPSLGYGELMQVCRNCGFVRYFRDIEVLAFLEEGADNG